ncbi:MAG: hypothetical protein J7L53_07235 [Deltaproteobacteria bacterium]|nr:hypothetical protein [Deltaproteobacteria bacterium]
MKRLLAFLLTVLVMACATPVWADAVYVIRGDHQSEGTYMAPRVYSAQPGVKSDNYETLKNSYQLIYPGYRDRDSYNKYNVFPIIWTMMEIMTEYGPVRILIPIDCRYTPGF